MGFESIHDGISDVEKSFQEKKFVGRKFTIMIVAENTSPIVAVFVRIAAMSPMFSLVNWYKMDVAQKVKNLDGRSWKPIMKYSRMQKKVVTTAYKLQNSPLKF